MTLRVKKLGQEAIIPKYSHPGDAGLDLFSSQEAIIKPQERKLISTSIAMAIPDGHVGLIWDRSGIASKHGLKTMAGVIDSNYRGEIKILLHNLSNTEFKVDKGMRIAQILIQKVESKEVILVDDLDETNRNSNGFGSTGVK